MKKKENYIIESYDEFLSSDSPEKMNSVSEAKKTSIADTLEDQLTDIYDSSLNYKTSKKLVMKEITDIEEVIKRIKSDL